MSEGANGGGKGGTIAVVIGAVFFTGLAAWVAWYGWTATDAEMSIHGWIALVLGVVFSIGLGVGLMMLMFHSHKSGHDQAADDVQKDLDLH
jgi:flagellar basal body-associated protein FliL